MVYDQTAISCALNYTMLLYPIQKTRFWNLNVKLGEETYNYTVNLKFMCQIGWATDAQKVDQALF